MSVCFVMGFGLLVHLHLIGRPISQYFSGCINILILFLDFADFFFSDFSSFPVARTSLGIS